MAMHGRGAVVVDAVAKNRKEDIKKWRGAHLPPPLSHDKGYDDDERRDGGYVDMPRCQRGVE